VLGGGVTKMVLPSDEPLEIVTGDAPNPNKPPPLALCTALLNSSSRSVIEPVLRSNELPRVGVMTLASPG
jgi:hypothetical protein